jgi:hypothetical protein
MRTRLMKLVSLTAITLALATTLAGSASGQVLSNPPPTAGGPTANAIFDAMLAIARAASSNPSGAQAATFSYQAAIQQFNAHDFDRSRASALTAIMQSGTPALPQPTIAPPQPIPQPSFLQMPLVVGANEADAESYVALARRAMTQCGAPGAAPPAAVAQDYATAAKALVAKNPSVARASSQNVVDDCAGATAAYSQQQAAIPMPSATPMALGTYVPQPVATLIPDPALQGTSH